MDARKVFFYALEKYPEQVLVTALAPGTPVPGGLRVTEGTILESTRGGEKKYATLTVAVSDDDVKNLRGRFEGRDLYLLVKIPNHVIGRADSLIVLPGEDRK